ncbi:uncharacterized protein PODANS_5_4510 [Podospora anserina S mat+]|uniref:Podospora anserina S mat+ genomic DNA chromosome 5, supercontig 5 n=1 Tax=Podospora anserina (strain S / ATCC MYA-4624 / DSM 980 / FGSC 10383) TaxID=515849 RepID=B2AMM1_PODAN|nr:uncharacterized protein PODANS_5_4510 [Podospora anserina S mat+]CAP65212.1 unnamed protein product [Podospora anserina S mat+]CDP29424.1 Putative protein of unknown function [Podospora anserina S mat+]
MPSGQAVSPSSLPLTLQHAIHVTRQLGFRYLRVDALCIIQDSMLDWEEQAAQMHNIYVGATITIAADVGNSSGSGLSCYESRLLLHGKRIPDEDLRVVIEPYRCTGGMLTLTERLQRIGHPTALMTMIARRYQEITSLYFKRGHGPFKNVTCQRESCILENSRRDGKVDKM